MKRKGSNIDGSLDSHDEPLIQIHLDDSDDMHEVDAMEQTLNDAIPEYNLPVVRPCISYEDYEHLQGDQIFDSFFEKGKNMGHFANRIIRKMNEAKLITTGSTLCRKKSGKLEQREQFQRLDVEGLRYLHSLLKTELSDSKYIQKLLPSDDLKVRAAHLVADGTAFAILQQIFPLIPYHAQGIAHSHHHHTTVYEKNKSNVSNVSNVSNGHLRDEILQPEETKKTPIMIPNLWSSLAKEYFNNAQWTPSNILPDDGRTHYIDPSKAPVIPYTGPQLRLLFMTVRSQYSIAYAMFQDRLVAGEEIEFGEGSRVLFYVHLLYSTLPMQSPCMRDATVTTSTGGGGILTSTSPRFSTTSSASMPRFDQQTGFLPLSSSHQQSSSIGKPNTLIQEEDSSEVVSKSVAIEEYYRQATKHSSMVMRHREIEFLRKQLKEENFAVDVREAMEAKLTALLVE